MRSFTNDLLGTLKTNCVLKNPRRFLRHPGLDPLWAAIEREWWWQLVAYFGMLFAGLLLGHWAWSRSAIVAGLGLVATICAVTLLTQHLRRRPRQHPLHLLLRRHPETIVWIYTVQTQRMPFGIELFSGGTIYFHLANGEDLSMGLPADKLKLVSHTLSRLLPHATFGYSPEKAREFKARFSSNS